MRDEAGYAESVAKKAKKAAKRVVIAYSAMRHGDTFGQLLSASIDHSGDLSLWQVLQELGIFRASVLAGEMKRKV